MMCNLIDLIKLYVVRYTRKWIKIVLIQLYLFRNFPTNWSNYIEFICSLHSALGHFSQRFFVSEIFFTFIASLVESCFCNENRSNFYKKMYFRVFFIVFCQTTLRKEVWFYVRQVNCYSFTWHVEIKKKLTKKLTNCRKTCFLLENEIFSKIFLS